MSAHGIASTSIRHTVAVLTCRCGERLAGRRAAALAAYRRHKALATSKTKRRTPAAVVPITKA